MSGRPARGLRQRGVALLTVLLVVAVVTAVCAAIVGRQHLAIRLAGNQLHARQAWHYALGGEELARSVLRRDARDQDHRGEPWARRLPPWPVEGGAVAVRLDDLAGRFNLNALVRDGRPDALAVARFQRLLRHLDIDPGLAVRVVDWIDPDAEPGRPGGAEDAAHLREAPPRRAANRPLRDVSELRLLGLDAAAYARLAPHVAALPGGVALNVNTASAEVLASLADGLAPARLQALVAAQAGGGFTDVGAFLAHPVLREHPVPRDGLAVASDFFLATTEVVVDGRRQVLASTLARAADGAVRVVGRDLGHDPVVPPPPEGP